MAEMRRHNQAGAIWSNDGANLQHWRNIGTVTSNPTIGKSGYGGYTAFDGTDDKIAVGGVDLSIKSVSFRVYAATDTEQFIDFDGGSKYIHISSGTVTATGFTSPTIYVDGVATTTMAAAGWHHVAVTSATAVASTQLQFGTDNSAFGNIFIREISLWDRALSAAEVLSLANGTVWRYGDSEVSRWDMSNINPPDVSFAGNGNDGTGTGLVASTDIVDGPYGGKALEFNGTDEWVQLPNLNSLIAGRESLSISCLFRPDSVAVPNRGIMALGTSASDRQMWLFANNQGIGLHVVTTNGLVTNNSANVLEVGLWIHVVCTYDGEAIFIYINGVRDTNDATTAQTGGLVSSADGYFLGKGESGTPWPGAIADARIYFDALTQVQAADLYASIRRGI